MNDGVETDTTFLFFQLLAKWTQHFLRIVHIRPVFTKTDLMINDLKIFAHISDLFKNIAMASFYGFI